MMANDDAEHIARAFPAELLPIAINNNKRVDYVLQEHALEGMSGLSEYLSSLGGHTNYFDLPDVGRFIVEHVTAAVPLQSEGRVGSDEVRGADEAEAKAVVEAERK